jgi:DNA polymerase III delta prime subunit
MVGQKNLIDKLTSYSIFSFPQTLLLLGDKGSGKHLLVSEVIAPHLKLNVIDMTDKVFFDYISEIQIRAVPAIYLIDVSLLSDKEQNMLLKLIEEPINNSYVILLSNNKQTLLPTVLNRCVSYVIEPYSKEELSSFINYSKKETRDFALKICNTPGQIVLTSETKMDELIELSKKFVSKVKDAGFYNTLSVSKKLKYKDEEDKFDIDIFLNALLVTIADNYKLNDNQIFLSMYYKTMECKKNISNNRLNKEMAIENYLTSLWKLTR